MSRTRYVVITPARDEADNIERTVRCMAAQTVLPAQWVIVNDGSTDDTGSLLDSLAEEFDWLKVVHNPDRGFRAAGSGVMEAFYAGFDVLDVDDWDYIVKFDADLNFEPDYFQLCFEEFEKDPDLGIAGGVILNRIGDRLELEKHPRFHVRGATKIYRRSCWDSIGGLIREPGWDTHDEVKANMLGFTTRSFDSPHLIQERFTGDAAGQWSNWIKNGRASYICGYHPAFLVAKAAARCAKHPHLKATAGLIVGYVSGVFGSTRQVGEPDVIRYLKQQQFRRLIGLESMWR